VAKLGINLRAIEESDLKLLQIWRNSDKVMPWCRQYRELSKADMLKWYKQMSEDKHYNLVNDLFIIASEGEDIGVGGLVRIDWRNRKGEVSFYVAKKVSEDILAQALLCVMGYAFKTLNLYKVYLPCYQGNPNIPIYERCMNREYVACKEYYLNGRYLDRIVLTAYNNYGETR